MKEKSTASLPGDTEESLVWRRWCSCGVLDSDGRSGRIFLLLFLFLAQVDVIICTHNPPEVWHALQRDYLSSQKGSLISSSSMGVNPKETRGLPSKCVDISRDKKYASDCEREMEANVHRYEGKIKQNEETRLTYQDGGSAKSQVVSSKLLEKTAANDRLLLLHHHHHQHHHHHRRRRRNLTHQQRTKPVYSVSVLEGGEGELPCDLALTDPRDSVQLILWIKEGDHTPLYSYDYRAPHTEGGPRGMKLHRAPNSTLSSRITFHAQAPAALVMKRVRASDTGVYRCRVDHLRSPTTNTRTNLTVVVPVTRVQITWSPGDGGSVKNNGDSGGDGDGNGDDDGDGDGGGDSDGDGGGDGDSDDDGDGVGQSVMMVVNNGLVGPFKEGSSPVITCTSLDGWPPPTVVWYEGKEIIDSTHDDVTDTIVFPAFDGSNTSGASEISPIDSTHDEGTDNIVSPAEAFHRSNTSGTSEISPGKNEAHGGPSNLGPNKNRIVSRSLANKYDKHDMKAGEEHAKFAMPATRVTNSVTLKNVTRGDLHRRLTCRASNTNQTRPVTATVTLDMILPVVGVVVSGVEAVWAGEEREVECWVYGCRPQPLVVWWLESSMLPTDSYKTSEDGNLTIAILKLTPKREDDGVMLICQATNTKLPQLAYQDSVILSVNYAPVCLVVLGRSLDPARIKEGDDVYFECSVHAKPPATAVTWRHNGVELVSGGGVFVSNMSLVVQQVTRTRGGNYTCHATNTRATTPSAPLHLDVKFAPVCGVQDRIKHSVAIRENAQVSCKVDANPPLVTFKWIFNNTAEAIDVPRGRFVVVSTESRVNYSPMNELDYGTLLCWANNSVGVQSQPCVFHILPAGKPDPPHNCQAINVTLTSLKVTCLPGDDGGLTQTFLLQMFPLGSQQPTVEMTEVSPQFTVSRLRPATTYLVGVAGVNHRGASRPTHLQVLTRTVATNTLQASAEPTLKRDEGWSVPVGVSVGAGVVAGVLIVIGVIIVTVVMIQHRSCPSRPPTPPPQPSKSLSVVNKEEDTPLLPYCSPHFHPDLIPITPDPGGGIGYGNPATVSAAAPSSIQSVFHGSNIPLESETEYTQLMCTTNPDQLSTHNTQEAVQCAVVHRYSHSLSQLQDSTVHTHSALVSTVPYHSHHQNAQVALVPSTPSCSRPELQPYLHSCLHLPTCPHTVDSSLLPLQLSLNPSRQSIHLSDPTLHTSCTSLHILHPIVCSSSSPVHSSDPLFNPQGSLLVRREDSSFTPLPCDVPDHASNPKSPTNMSSSGLNSFSKASELTMEQRQCRKTSNGQIEEQKTNVHKGKMESPV